MPPEDESKDKKQEPHPSPDFSRLNNRPEVVEKLVEMARQRDLLKQPPASPKIQ